eukprot:CAMPEP_0175747214 /NCGR_PEP_ID=MMETSP0097-20121207/58984_1 /TAXON_ID=311494 /ORGANISM="Alexandrium monilatum, Strain CCMP3105" /LENGTH=73 /DNA_ID=CAMNT_0017055661 /DNA_START=53 /DNA_END=272 /DNA_ORIENTATION=-
MALQQGQGAGGPAPSTWPNPPRHPRRGRRTCVQAAAIAHRTAQAPSMPPARAPEAARALYFRAGQARQPEQHA